MTKITLTEPFLHRGTHYYEVDLAPITPEQRVEIVATNGQNSRMLTFIAASTGLPLDVVGEMSITDLAAISMRIDTAALL